MSDELVTPSLAPVSQSAGSLLEPGSIFARDYRVLRPLRSGGMGSVLVVEHLSTGKLRALKLLAPELELNADMRERFVREARAASAIESEHVVEIVTAGIDEATDRPFIVMELLHGEDLGDRVERLGPLDHATLALVARQLGHPLGAAHKLGIIHRDLKPENIFLARGRRPGADFTVKLLDFGVAKMLSRGEAQAPTQPLGSPLFMAPEQTDSDGEIGPGTDVWALGLLAFFLLTGEYFWIAAESGSVPALLREVCFDDVPPASIRAAVLGATREALPVGFDEWFKRCVARDLADRYADGEEAANALAQLLEEEQRTVSIPATALDDPEWDEAPSIEPAAVDATTHEERSSVDGAAISTSNDAEAMTPDEPLPGTQRSPDPPADVVGPSAIARLRVRLGSMRNVAGGVVAGCLGGVLCFLAVGLLEAPIARTAASASARLSASAFEADESHRPPAAEPVAAAPPAASAPPARPPSSASSAAAARKIEAPKPVEPRKRFAFEPRPQDERCPEGMRRIDGPHGSFCMDATEVVVGAWNACVARGACKRLDRAIRFAGFRPDGIDAARESCVEPGSSPDLPVNCVDRETAASFCASRSARLPSDEEWTIAALGGGGAARRFPWGAEPPSAQRMNACDEQCVEWTLDAGLLRNAAFAGDDGADTLAPVGSYAAGASPDQVLDLLGNVAEWTSGAADGPGVARGGSFLATSVAAMLEPRSVDPRAASPEIGFRCAGDVDDG